MNAIELILLWQGRDEQYRAQANRHTGRFELSPEMEAAVRDNRRREVDMLAATERAAAWSVLMAWTAPVVRGMA